MLLGVGSRGPEAIMVNLFVQVATFVVELRDKDRLREACDKLVLRSLSLLAESENSVVCGQTLTPRTQGEQHLDMLRRESPQAIGSCAFVYAMQLP